MTLKFTILGCGTSTGVPRVDGDWGACDPANPKNRRRRCSLLVQRFGGEGVTTVLVDTSPDLREQLIDARVSAIDGVLYTHDHADHTHGIDDLRILAYRMKRRIDVYYNEGTGAILNRRFEYCFAMQQGSSYPPILKGHLIEAGRPFSIEGKGGAIEVLPFLQHHGEIDSLGFRFAGLAYSSDIAGLPETSPPLLAGLDVWIVDALRYARHPSHFNLEEALAWIGKLAPRRSILTHMHIDLDYETLRAALPESVEPAFDGMTIVLDET